MTFSKILCCTDFSEGSQRALEAAITLAKGRNSRLFIAHAWSIPITVVAPDMAMPFVPIQPLLDGARRNLDEAVGVARDAGVDNVTPLLLNGSAWHELTHALREHAIELCVIGTHGRTGFARVLLGSVAEKVIRHSPCPVLAVRPNNTVESFKHVLVPTDFSPSAQCAARLATQLVEPAGMISLLTVLEVPISFAGEVMLPEYTRSIDTRAAMQLETETVRLRNLTSATVKASTRIGYAGGQILSAVDHDTTIDLVVMGSHGRTGVTRALLGSVAEKVVRHARCPVLVAREKE